MGTKKNNLKRILVTGANGFIGRNLCKVLLKHNYTVLGIDLSCQELTSYPVVNTDLLELENLSKIVAEFNPDWVVHLAEKRPSPYSYKKDFSLLKNNITVLSNLFLSLEGRSTCFIYFSSGEVYGKGKVPYKESYILYPLSEYGFSKFVCEKLCQYYYQSQQRTIVIIRPSVAYGPGQYSDMLIPTIISKALRREKLDLTEGKQSRDFIYIEDLIDFVIKVISKELSGFYIFNLGSGKEISIREVTKKIMKLLGDPIKPNFGALPYRESEVWHYYLDIKNAYKVLGWRPKTKLEEGLKKTIFWWREKLNSC